MNSAGLSVAIALNTKAHVDIQSLRNVNDGISYLNVADGGVSELKNILMRLRELATQSSNGSFSNTQRQALDVEAQALQGEYNRIIDMTQLNGISVFENQTLFVQAGAGVDGILEVTLAAFSSVTSGDGTFQAGSSFASGTHPTSISIADFNGDGVLDLVSADVTSGTLSVLLGNGDGTFQTRRSFTAGSSAWAVSVADFDDDGVLDLVSADANSSSTLNVLLGNGDGTFQTRRSFAVGNSSWAVSVADFDGDGVMDLVSGDGNNNTLSVLLGNGDGTFQARSSFASGIAPRSVSVADFDGDGVLDLVSADLNSSKLSVFLGNGDGTFQARRSFAAGSSPYSVAVADMNGDGVLDLASADWGSSTLSVLLGNSTTTTSLQGISHIFGISVATQSAALQAESKIDSYLDNVTAITGVVGAGLSRFESAANLLSSSAEVTKAAESRIRDVDVAEESARLVSTSILQQTASAILAHALKDSELVLTLLRPSK